MFSICEVEGCEEPIMKGEMQSHMDLHLAELVAMEQYEEQASGPGTTDLKKVRKEISGRKHKSESGREHHGDHDRERSSKKRKESRREYGVRRLGVSISSEAEERE